MTRVVARQIRRIAQRELASANRASGEKGPCACRTCKALRRIVTLTAEKRS